MVGWRGGGVKARGWRSRDGGLVENGRNRLGRVMGGRGKGKMLKKTEVLYNGGKERGDGEISGVIQLYSTKTDPSAQFIYAECDAYLC